MPSRKRGLAEVEAEPSPPASQQPTGLLKRLRNAWVFSCLMQFIALFGDVFKIDKEFDIEDLEEECLQSGPRLKLAEIGLCLLKSISSQRGLTSSDFDEYTSRQYKRRLPDRPNPFGGGEEPIRFLDFDVFTQLHVLHQLSLWTLLHPERIREKMDKGDRDVDWRIDIIGWDREDRSYFLLDDSRLYRRSDAPMKAPAKPKPKPKPKPAPKARPSRPGARSSKRLKLEADDAPAEVEEEVEAEELNDNQPEASKDNETDLGEGYRWENVAISLSDYEAFLASIYKSRDPNERNLHKHLTDEVLPQIQKAEENRQRKIAQRERDLMNLEKLAHAKRSTRIAGKMEREMKEAEGRAAEEKYRRELVAAKADAERQKQMEEARESRMLTRDQRLKEREYKRILQEEELANLAKASEALEAGEAKLSERRLKADLARKQKELEELEQEEDWVFDCAKCGVYGENIDDGTPSMACERCSVWQHIACLGFSREEAEKDDFHFVCDTCIRREKEAKQREEDAKKPKLPPIKLQMPLTSAAPTSATPPGQPRKRGRPRKHPLPEGQEAKPPANGEGGSAPKKRKPEPEQFPGMPPMKKFKLPKPKAPAAGPGPAPTAQPLQTHIPVTPNGYQAMRYTFMNGPTLSPQGQLNTPHGSNGIPRPPPGLMSPPGPPSTGHGTLYASPYGQGPQPVKPVAPHNDASSSYGFSNGHSPTKPAPLSPAVGSSPSLNNIPSPMIQPPRKDMQAAGLSPTKQSPPTLPAGSVAPSPAPTPSGPAPRLQAAASPKPATLPAVADFTPHLQSLEFSKPHPAATLPPAAAEAVAPIAPSADVPGAHSVAKQANPPVLAPAPPPTAAPGSAAAHPVAAQNQTQAVSEQSHQPSQQLPSQSPPQPPPQTA